MAAEENFEVETEPFKFHPCSTPRGLSWYDLSVLTAFQQKQLNEIKVDVIRKDNQYLTAHPEIRAIIAIFVREVFKKLPITSTIAEFARSFFTSNKDDLQEKITEYLEERGEHINVQDFDGLNATYETPNTPHASSIDINDDYPSPCYYYYLSYTDESSEREEDMCSMTQKSDFGSMTTTPYSFTTGISDFNKKYGIENKLEPNSAIQVTPVATDDDIMSELDETTINLTKNIISAASVVPSETRSHV